MKQTFRGLLFIFVFAIAFACSLEVQPKRHGHKDMVRSLKSIQRQNAVAKNPFAPEARLKHVDSVLNLDSTPQHERIHNTYVKALTLLELGKERESIKLLQHLAKNEAWFRPDQVPKDLAMAYMRLGERSNCVAHHASASCILPIKGMGVHEDRSGSQLAIEVYKEILGKNPADLESRWLLIIAYMTLGEYPNEVPKEFLIEGLDKDSEVSVNPFEDIAGPLKLDARSMAGGSIVDDLNNDGYLDILTSSWGVNDKLQYFRNNGDGTFSNVTANANLKGITGGLNLVQADYNNDGFVDILVLRGAWKKGFGKEPNSLLRNNGDDTFTDVTMESRLMSFRPTQTATWADFNNDGWLDLFIGNETDEPNNGIAHPCELYINNQNGTFMEIAEETGSDMVAFVKGVSSGDFNNDGWQDIFISTIDSGRKLLRNNGLRNGKLSFEDVSATAGLLDEQAMTFTTWFWDYNNDGWLDILAVDYSFEKSLAHYAAAAEMGEANGNSGKVLLYRNNQDGTFTNVSGQSGLDQVVFSMGGNFGDIDNDGWLDMYFGTGNPRYQSLIPNKMFKNLGNGRFTDVTAAARVGHLQKGHGVSFADLDNDGDQDVFIQMGGAYPGDAFHNSFFLNSGHYGNSWISLNLIGTISNRSAIGSRVSITFKEGGARRTVYRDVNSGGSFGASPLRLEVGLGRAEKIEKLEIRWAGTDEVDIYEDVKVNQFIQILQGQKEIQELPAKRVNWVLPDNLEHQHHDGHKM